MQDNKLSIGAMSDSTGFDSVDEELFREELEAAAPHLLDQFDSIRHKHKHQLEEAGRQYNEIKADLDDLANEQAIIISNLSQSQENFGGASVSGISDRTRSTDSNSVSSPSSPANQQPQATTPAKTRVALSTSTSTNPA